LGGGSREKCNGVGKVWWGREKGDDAHPGITHGGRKTRTKKQKSLKGGDGDKESGKRICSNRNE